MVSQAGYFYEIYISHEKSYSILFTPFFIATSRAQLLVSFDHSNLEQTIAFFKKPVYIYYRILFDWNWDNPGYQVGKLMTTTLVSAHGKEVLKKYLSTDLMIFLQDYIKLAKKDPAKYPYSFSVEFEKMIDSVVGKVKSLQ